MIIGMIAGQIVRSDSGVMAGPDVAGTRRNRRLAVESESCRRAKPDASPPRGRAPAPAEIDLTRAFVTDLQGGWERYAQVLLLSDEFAFID